MHKSRRAFPLLLRILLAVLLLVAVFFLTLRLLPSRTLSDFTARQYSSRFYDRDGKLLYIMPLEDGLRREYYPLDQMGTNLVQAFIDAEDKNFRRHFGVNLFSLVRAAVQNGKEGRVVSGASTITMQLARIIWPRKGRVNLLVKTKEALLAVYLETKLSKDEILELYLNSVPFGQQIEGVGSAARSFFSCEPASLSPEQCLRLAEIPRRPADSQLEKSFVYPSLCMHFVNHVIASYKEAKQHIPPTLELAIDSSLTSHAEFLIQKKLEEYKEARIHNGAAIVLDNRTGEVLVWAGNASFDDDAHSGQIDGVSVRNQPGSSMKPFLYALAMEEGFSPSSVLPDIQQDFGSSGVYVPLNFNNRYNGPVRFRTALASSLNIPAVYLLHELGLKNYMERLYLLGFDSLRGSEEGTGLSLALGSSEVTLEEMARAFSVFTNDGLLMDVSYTKAGGSSRDGWRRAYKSDTARVMCDILTDEGARSLGFGHASVFDTPYPSIFKTGTSNQFQNIIALGSTTSYTVAVWMGNFEGETVIGETGSSIPARVVRSLLDELTQTGGAANFKQPASYRKVRLCALSGLLPTASCPSVIEEYVGKGSEIATCSWHYIENGRVKVHYPSEYQHWADSRNFLGNSAQGTGDSQGPLTITYPRNGALFIYDASLPASVQYLSVTAVGGKEKSASLTLDGQPVGNASQVFSWNIPLSRGFHVLTVTCGTERAVSEFEVK
ncbi:MAG: transglycosylase domain-containing protein [Treponema sp.]|nr:transglycosylase domain-containing protein [Treponema sp.]